MYDQVRIRRSGRVCEGSRYLRTDDGGVFQSVFYQGRCRPDPTAYARFAADDPVMNAAAERFLVELVDEAVAIGHLH